MIAGDFNQITNLNEKLSNNSAVRGGQDLMYCINSLNLVDLPTCGNWFTWTNNRHNQDAVWERIDKTFTNAHWLQYFPTSWVEVLPIAASNHAPLVIHLQNYSIRKPKSFCFEVMWLNHPHLKNLVRSHWQSPTNGSRAMQVMSKINHTAKGLTAWNKYEFGNLRIQIHATENLLQQLQKNIGISNDNTLEFTYRKRLDFLLNCEEIMWAQRAQQLWLIKGDRNTRSKIKLSCTSLSYIPLREH
ncbi:Endonuclease/exonuclease/phosphatase [Senna tora]|uniref:Endonuclease/exonuclease/phosphatase n=1 Tax=Senna tora TaxID=362788 RepID=A0A834X6N7_9FABA|nr:Endonuclease/exonuclease/phosphatase [Senna tora]